MSGGAPKTGFYRAAALQLAAFGGIALIAMLDVVTGPDFGGSLFYMIPVVVTAWKLGPLAGGFSALAATACWTLVDHYLRHQPSNAAMVWNAASRFALLMAFGLLIEELRRERRLISLANEKLVAMVKRESQLARTDVATGLPNARALRERLEVDLARARRSGNPLCIAYVDLDNFKSINDHYGHDAGDDVLAAIGSVIRESLRGADIAARVGGDEFVIILWETDRAGAVAVAERLITAISALGTRYPKARLGASAGIALFTDTTLDPTELIRIADEAMYTAKAEGKGRVRVVEG